MPGFQELVVLFAVGLLILGPERLPRVAIQIGRWAGKARRAANQLRYQMEREVALADMHDSRRNQAETEQDRKNKDPGNPGDRGADSKERERL